MRLLSPLKEGPRRKQPSLDAKLSEMLQTLVAVFNMCMLLNLRTGDGSCSQGSSDQERDSGLLGGTS